MPRANLLNTTDVTLRGLLANGLRYVVPPRQREMAGWAATVWQL